MSLILLPCPWLPIRFIPWKSKFLPNSVRDIAQEFTAGIWVRLLSTAKVMQSLTSLQTNFSALRYTSHSLEQDEPNVVKLPICIISSGSYMAFTCAIITPLSHIIPVGLPLH